MENVVLVVIESVPSIAKGTMQRRPNMMRFLRLIMAGLLFVKIISNSEKDVKLQRVLICVFSKQEHSGSETGG